MKPLAFIAVETDERGALGYDIVEVAAIRAAPDTLHVIAEAAVEVRPRRAARGKGRRHRSPRNALPLSTALVRIAPLLERAVLAGHDVGLDCALLDMAWDGVGLRPPDTHCHVVDTVALAWPLVAGGALRHLCLGAVREHLGIAIDPAEGALARARCNLEVARRLMPPTMPTRSLEALRGDERAIADKLLDRLAAGRARYGTWRTDDGRDYPREALSEVVDALHYVGAELVRLERHRSQPRGTVPRIYVCHALGSDVAREICQGLVACGRLPIAPELYLPQIVDSAAARDGATPLRLALLGACDEVWVYGAQISAAMREELAHARAHGIPVRHVDAEAA
jgi:DNA polymerase-3 subunit epsilon